MKSSNRAKKWSTKSDLINPDVIDHSAAVVAAVILVCKNVEDAAIAGNY